MVRIFITIVFTIYAAGVHAQHQNVLRAIIVKGDTIPYIVLEEVTVHGRALSTRRLARAQQRNARLEYNVRRVYPYARLAAQKINEIEVKLTKANRESDRKKIIKEEYSSLMKTFKAPLSKLSVNQGRILIRLIYRETSHSSFAHIKEYKGGVNAYFWQSLALLFGNNLKAAYNPAEGEDAEIENIVQKILRGE